MELILELDTALFLLINKSLANPITDALMPIITNLKYWLPIYFIGFGYAILKDKKQGIILLLMSLFITLLADQVSATFIKEWVGRLRPCKVLEDINLLVNCGSGKSFPSSHATNNFAVATIVSFFYKKQKIYFFLIAFLVAISRVFVGVHYPIDIIAGALIGVILAYITIQIYVLIMKKMPQKKP